MHPPSFGVEAGFAEGDVVIDGVPHDFVQFTEFALECRDVFDDRWSR